jgi:hypothetical protein
LSDTTAFTGVVDTPVLFSVGAGVGAGASFFPNVQPESTTKEESMRYLYIKSKIKNTYPV